MSGKFAILIDGPIGVGKTTFGRALARRFEGTFVDGDDLTRKGKPWYHSSLSTCRRICEVGLKSLEQTDFLFVSRPVRCLDWIYFKHQFERKAVGLVLIGLQSSVENITHESRGRSFSPGEIKRMAEMIQQGYGAREYSDLTLRTDQSCISETAILLEAGLRQQMERLS